MGDGPTNGTTAKCGKTTRHAANVGEKGRFSVPNRQKGIPWKKWENPTAQFRYRGRPKRAVICQKFLFLRVLRVATLGLFIRKYRGLGNRCSESSETEIQGQNGKIGRRGDGTPPSFNKTKDGPEFDVNSAHVKTYKLRPEGFEPPTLGSEETGFVTRKTTSNAVFSSILALL